MCKNLQNFLQASQKLWIGYRGVLLCEDATLAYIRAVLHFTLEQDTQKRKTHPKSAG